MMILPQLEDFEEKFTKIRSKPSSFNILIKYFILHNFCNLKDENYDYIGDYAKPKEEYK